MDALQAVIEEIIRFRDERDWAQFHAPKELSAAISIECGELQELMLWKTPEKVAEFLATPSGKRQCSSEIADILIFGLLFCNEIGVDPIEAIRVKLKENAQKYSCSKRTRSRTHPHKH